MSVKTFIRAVAIAWPLVLAITLYAFASDRDSGPAGAAGFGRPSSAYGESNPFQSPSRNVRGNKEFTRQKDATPEVREEQGNATPYVWGNTVIDRNSADTGN